ncbi:hypothetical protein ACQ4M3_39235 [Leptolyngbya sp. AN03gr2]|uniref:hypothetical protein n=1 Tax=unclassified Leptolyngbya TaxID=2650499 RepID=UPI003D313D6A
MLSVILGTAAKVTQSYQTASRTGQLPLWLISAIAFYIPLEDFIVAWLPVPSAVRTGIRFIPEIIIYITLARTLYYRVATGRALRKTPIDILVVGFFVASAISVVINQASIFGSITELRFNWRYLAIYYTLANIDISTQQLGAILRNLKVIGLIQAGLATIQIAIPSRIKIAIAAGNCDKADLKGASCGTFFDSALLSGFLLIIIAVHSAQMWTVSDTLIPTLKDAVSLLILYLGVFASKKRIALLVAALIPIVVLYFLGKRRSVAKLIWVIAVVAVPVVFILPTITSGNVSQAEEGTSRLDLTSYFGAIFSEEYWQHNLSASRGWFVVNISNAIVSSGRWFGFGPEPNAVIQGMKAILTHSDDIAKLERDIDAFEDPYWFAVMAYFGIVGVILYWLILFRLYRASRWLIRVASSRAERSLGVMFCTITSVSFFYSFSERLFKLRPFSFYFWLLAGLMISMCYSQGRSMRENNGVGSLNAGSSEED